MLRILGFLTIMLVLVAGCSQKQADTDTQSAAESESSLEKTGDSPSTESTSSDVSTTEKGPPEPSKQDDGSAMAEPAGKADDATSDPETRAIVLKLLDGMGSDAVVERRAASDQLDELGEAGVPFIVIGLREGTIVQQRGAATYLIGRVSPRDQDAAQALISALKAEDRALRRAALQAVEKLADDQLTAALPALLTFAGNRDLAEGYRSRAVRAISKLGLQAAPAAEDVTRLALDDSSLNVRRACYFAMAKIASQEQAESFYCDRIKNESEADLRRLAAKWLAGVAKSEQSLVILITAMQDQDEEVRLQAVDSLVELGKPALPSLVTALESPNAQTRRHAALAIGKMGLLAADARSALEARLDDPDPQVQELVRAALQALK